MIFQFSRMKKISMISDNDAERFSLNIKLENDRTMFVGKSRENAHIELEPLLGFTCMV